MRAPLKPQSQLDFAEQALRTWGDTVFRVALGQTGSRADAEDICQDVFLRLLNAQTIFESDEHVKAWLIRVAINASRDLQRRQVRRAIDSLEDHRAEAEQKLAQTGSEATGREDGGELWQLVRALPAEQRTAIELFYGEDCTTDEVADLCGCSPGAVRMRLHRARETLRALLAREASSNESANPHGKEHHG